MLIQHRHEEFLLPRYMHPTYTGRGFGSLFGKLFAKVGSKVASTGLRSAISAGSKIARKGITTAVKRVGTKGIKSAIKTVSRKGVRAGKQMVKNQIKTAPQKLLNYAIKEAKRNKVPQLMRRTVVKGSRHIANKIVSDISEKQPLLGEIIKEVKEIASLPPTVAARSAKRRIAHPLPRPLSLPPIVNKRKRKLVTTQQKPAVIRKKRRKIRKRGKINYALSDINSLIARS